MLSLADNFIFVVLCVFLLVLVLGFGQPVANLGRLLQWFWQELQRAVRDRLRDNALPQDEEVAMPEPFAAEEDPLPVPQPQEEEVALPAPFAPEEVPQRDEDNREPFIPTAPSASDSTILIVSSDDDDSSETSETSTVVRRTQSEPSMDTGKSSADIPNRPKIRRSPRAKPHAQNETSGSQNESNAAVSAVGAPSPKTRKPKPGTCNGQPTIPETSEPSSGSKEESDATATSSSRGISTSTNKEQREPPAPGPDSQEHRDPPTTETRQVPRGRSQRMSEMSQVLAGIQDHRRRNAFQRSSGVLSSTRELAEPKLEPKETRKYLHGWSTPRYRRLTKRTERLAGTHTPPVDVTPTTCPILTGHAATIDSVSGDSTCTTPRRSSRLAAKTAMTPLPEPRRKPITAGAGDTVLVDERRSTHRVISAPQVLTPVFEQEEVGTPGRVLRSMAARTEGPSDGSTSQTGAGDKTKKGQRATRRVTSAPQVFQRQQPGKGRGYQTRAAISSRDANQRELLHAAGRSRQATTPDDADKVVEEDRAPTRRAISAPQQLSGRVLRSMTESSSSATSERDARSKQGQKGHKGKKRRPRS